MGTFNTSFGKVFCDPTRDGGGWHLALNIDTSDGNHVNYGNTGFWESTEACAEENYRQRCLTDLQFCRQPCGGASGEVSNAMTLDYKNINVFAHFQAKSIMIMRHQEGSVDA